MLSFAVVALYRESPGDPLSNQTSKYDGDKKGIRGKKKRERKKKKQTNNYEWELEDLQIYKVRSGWVLFTGKNKSKIIRQTFT